MAEKNKPTPRTIKVAVVQLDPIEGAKTEDGSPIEIENWPEDGKDNIIPIGRPFQCSIHLAERLKNAGRIKKYTITTEVVG